MSINDYYTCILCHHNLIRPDQLNAVLRFPSHLPPSRHNDLEAVLVQEVTERCGSLVNGETWNRTWREIMVDALRANWRVFGLCDVPLGGRREMIVFRWCGFSVMDRASVLECQEYEGCCGTQASPIAFLSADAREFLSWANHLPLPFASPLAWTRPVALLSPTSQASQTTQATQTSHTSHITQTTHIHTSHTTELSHTAQATEEAMEGAGTLPANPDISLQPDRLLAVLSPLVAAISLAAIAAPARANPQRPPPTPTFSATATLARVDRAAYSLFHRGVVLVAALCKLCKLCELCKLCTLKTEEAEEAVKTLESLLKQCCEVVVVSELAGNQE